MNDLKNTKQQVKLYFEILFYLVVKNYNASFLTFINIFTFY